MNHVESGLNITCPVSSPSLFAEREEREEEGEEEDWQTVMQTFITPGSIEKKLKATHVFHFTSSVSLSA